MNDPGTPQQQLIHEITQLRQRNAVLEAQLAQSQQAEADQQQIYDSLPVLVATAGCFRGLQCGRSASAVGYAATSAVVTSIVLIIVADALITVICQVIGV